MKLKKVDTEYTSYPICPFCGHEDMEWWDCLSGERKEDDDTWETECPSCGSPYKTTIHISYNFTTKRNLQ